MSNTLPPSPSNSFDKPKLGSKRSTRHGNRGIVHIGPKRVRSACERCRLKKTKCDGESTCKRCKDDGLICTVAIRKKKYSTSFPLGYTEVLGNTHTVLIATIRKLYTMVLEREIWNFGEPDVNAHGMPVIQSIAEKLECIRPSLDLPCIVPEDAEGLVELREKMKMDPNDGKRRRHLLEESHCLAQSPTFSRLSSGADNSELSEDGNQMSWSSDGLQEPMKTQEALKDDPFCPIELNEGLLDVDVLSSFQTQGITPTLSSDSLVDSKTQFPVLNFNPFNVGSGDYDELPGTAHILGISTQYVHPYYSCVETYHSDMMDIRQSATCWNNLTSTKYIGGTIRPDLLEEKACHENFD